MLCQMSDTACAKWPGNYQTIIFSVGQRGAGGAETGGTPWESWDRSDRFVRASSSNSKIAQSRHIGRAQCERTPPSSLSGEVLADAHAGLRTNRRETAPYSIHAKRRATSCWIRWPEDWGRHPPCQIRSSGRTRPRRRHACGHTRAAPSSRDRSAQQGLACVCGEAISKELGSGTARALHGSGRRTSSPRGGAGIAHTNALSGRREAGSSRQPERQTDGGARSRLCECVCVCVCDCDCDCNCDCDCDCVIA